MSEHAKRMKRELVMKGTILDVYKDTMELPNGKTEEWDFVSHRKGAAAVVAVREDGKLLMVRQYRNALERMTLEIPAGARDSVTEDTKVCAARELEEETGYRSENLSFLLSLRTTVAFCDEFIDVYLARDLVKSAQHLDEGEAILGIAKNYFMGIGAGSSGKIEYSDEFQFLEDNRVYTTKMYGMGRPKDNNSFQYLDISKLKPQSLKVEVTNTEGNPVNTKAKA